MRRTYDGGYGYPFTLTKVGALLVARRSNQLVTIVDLRSGDRSLVDVPSQTAWLIFTEWSVTTPGVCLNIVRAQGARKPRH